MNEAKHCQTNKIKESQDINIYLFQSIHFGIEVRWLEHSECNLQAEIIQFIYILWPHLKAEKLHGAQQIGDAAYFLLK